MIFAHHDANALDGRNCRPHAGFRVEAVRPAAAARIAFLTAGLALNRVLFPIGGGYVLIRARHLHATVAGNRSRFSRG